MVETAFARRLRTKLEDRETDAQGQWWEAGSVLQTDLDVDGERWREIVRRIGRPLTWRIWELAIEEASALVESPQD